MAVSDHTPDPTTEQEEWRAIARYEGVYEVSNLGRVRRVPASRLYPAGHVLYQHPAGKGHNYRTVTLCGGGKVSTIYVHRLVAEAFIGPLPEGAEVNHKRGTAAGNAATNLEIVTPLGNMRHARESGLLNITGEMNGAAKLTEESVRAIRASDERLVTLAARYGVSISTISLVRLRKAWRHVA